MIERKDILSIPFLKKTAFTGSYEGMRYSLKVIKKEEKQILETAAWEGPYAGACVPEEKKEKIETPFSEAGIQQAIDWLNRHWEAEPERWKKARTNW